MSAIPPNAYKPFGTGQRACIGRQFALQEAVLVLGMLLQRFELIKDPNYRLHTKVTLTVKPADLYVQVRRRADRPIDKAEPVAASSTTQTKSGPGVSNAHHTPLAVLFGSNLGTAEGIANRLAQEGTERGYDVTLGSLDEYVDQIPAKAVMIVCASYNGLPPDNAIKFHHALHEAGPTAYEDLPYTVFGCGNTEWATTTRRFPPNSMPGWSSTAPPASTRVAPATRAATSMRRTATGMTPCGMTSPPPSGLMRRTNRRQSAAARDHGDESAGDQPGDHVLPRAGSGGA